MSFVPGVMSETATEGSSFSDTRWPAKSRELQRFSGQSQVVSSDDKRMLEILEMLSFAWNLLAAGGSVFWSVRGMYLVMVGIFWN